MAQPFTTFEEMELRAPLMQAVKKMGFKTPTPVQAQTIPYMLEGYDVIAKAPTGTGKTCAFGIPILETLRDDCTDVQALILCPTRELCVQIADEMRGLAACMPHVKIAAIYGGQPMAKQIAQLQKNPQVVVATPGRLLDHMGRGNVWIGDIYTAVLDEADEMLKMGFVKDVCKILNATPGDTQVVMFSATISREVMDIAWQYQHDAVDITIEAQGDNRPKIAQYRLVSTGDQRIADMYRIIDEFDYKRVMVFANMKNTVRWLHTRVQRDKRSVDCLHGDMPQSQRNRVMAGYRKGAFEILIATDVAARGIDVDDVEAVFNFDVPDENEYYLHRIGRTGRAKRTGAAFTFVPDETDPRMRDIAKYTHSQVDLLTRGEDGSLLCPDGTPLAEKLK